MENKNYLLSFIKYIKLAKKQYIIGFLSLILSIITSIYSVNLISKIFDKNFLIMPKNEIFTIILKIALVYLGIKIMESIFTIIRRYNLLDGVYIVYVNIQKMIYDHIQSLPIKYFDSIPAGSVLSKIVSDTNQIRAFFENILVETVAIILKIFIVFLVLFYINFKIAIYISLIFPIILIIQRIYKKISDKYIFEYRKTNSNRLALLNEIFQNLEVVKSFNIEEKVMEEFSKESKKLMLYNRILCFLDGFLLHNLFSFISEMIKISIYLYYFYSEYNNLNLITLSSIFIFLYYIDIIVIDLAHITGNISVYSRAKGAAKNLYELLNLEVEEKKGDKILKDFKGTIKMENLYFAYEGENYVLKNINLEIKENETVAFVGHTGSGKSTIMNLLIKFYENQKGSIYISGEDIKNLDNKYLRDNISIVLQDSFLFDGNLLSNICDDEKESIRILEMLGARYIVDERGIDEKVISEGKNFSTGEKQLISFARALAKNPKILILDEATSNIDSKTEEKIQQGIEILRKNRTTLIIAHRLSTIRSADTIYVLDKGTIIEKGNHTSLIKQNGVYKQMIERDFKNE